VVENEANEDLVPFEISDGYDSVFIAADVENHFASDKIDGVERLLHVRWSLPEGCSNLLIPPSQWCFSIPVLGIPPKIAQLLDRNNMHDWPPRAWIVPAKSLSSRNAKKARAEVMKAWRSRIRQNAGGWHGTQRRAHPEDRQQLRDYLHLIKGGHEPLSLSLGLAMHRQFLRHGDMRDIDWEEFR
jgi:hypothetical protein